MLSRLAIPLLAAVASVPVAAAAADADVVIIDGNPSSGFGSEVLLLSGGRFAVSAPADFVAQGAVYLYDAHGTLLDQIAGSAEGDFIGSIVAVGDGNLVLCSPRWNGQRGAVTWLSGSGGWPDAISAENSLVGSRPMDSVCSRGVVRLANGNFVVRSPGWQSSPDINVGAVTWGDGNSPLVGAVSAANSLVGSHDGDANEPGLSSLLALANGNYVVAWPFWSNGDAAFAGAVTFGNGATGISGVVSEANSLVGTKSSDLVGARVAELMNGNVVVASPNWDRGSVFNTGAVTWMSGTTGAVGAVAVANSLVGVTENDFVGESVTALSSGNYVVGSPQWSRSGPGGNHGAVTWLAGIGPAASEVREDNSIIGVNDDDRVGSSVVALSNGNYVIVSPDTGAGVGGRVTWADGTHATAALVTSANSLGGSGSIGDGGVFALRNGNYVVVTPQWADAAGDGGAVTWGNGSSGTVGVVSSANSITSSQFPDLQRAVVVPLANGNYVLSAPGWSAPGAYGVGAAMLVSGTAPTAGTISAATALVGTAVEDFVGVAVGFPSSTTSIVEVDGGDYFVRSSMWDLPGGTIDAGAITRRSGNSFAGGQVSAGNSIVGGYAREALGSRTLAALPDGSVMALTKSTAQQPGSAVWLPPGRTIVGEPQGEIRLQGPWSVLRYDASRARALLGAPDASRVALWRAPHDTTFQDGFE